MTGIFSKTILAAAWRRLGRGRRGRGREVRLGISLPLTLPTNRVQTGPVCVEFLLRVSHCAKVLPGTFVSS